MIKEYPEMSENFDWFVEHYDELYEKYGTCYMAIVDKEVRATYPTYGEAVDDISKTVPYGKFNVQYCDGTKWAYTAHFYSFWDSDIYN